MRIHIAGSLDDIQNVKELREEAEWERARRFLAQKPKDRFADHLRWLEDDGRPVACVQVYLHQYAIGSARVGICIPEYPFVPPRLRGRGYFKGVMRDLLQWIVEAGCPLAYDHGRKGLYTSPFGYAPCFHHCIVLVRVEDALRLRAAGRVEVPTEAEVAALEHIFRRPFPFGRGFQCRDEAWRPDWRCVRLSRDAATKVVHAFGILDRPLSAGRRAGKPTMRSEHDATGDVLTLTDAWASDGRTGAVLLRAIAEEAEGRGIGWIRLNCRRGDALARIAVLSGGELRWCAAQERDHTDKGEDVDGFYLASLPLAIRQLMAELNVRWGAFDGRAPAAIRLTMEEQETILGLGSELRILEEAERTAPTVRLPRKAMTRAVMGYARPTELALLHEGCELPDGARAVADALFPATEAHLMHEGYVFAKPDQFGLVP